MEENKAEYLNSPYFKDFYLFLVQNILAIKQGYNK